MKIDLASATVGVLAGFLYALLRIPLPARPAVAPMGRLDMLIGEQVVLLAKRLEHGQ